MLAIDTYNSGMFNKKNICNGKKVKEEKAYIYQGPYTGHSIGALSHPSPLLSLTIEESPCTMRMEPSRDLNSKKKRRT